MPPKRLLTKDNHEPRAKKTKTLGILKPVDEAEVVSLAVKEILNQMKTELKDEFKLELGKAIELIKQELRKPQEQKDRTGETKEEQLELPKPTVKFSDFFLNLSLSGTDGEDVEKILTWDDKLEEHVEIRKEQYDEIAYPHNKISFEYFECMSDPDPDSDFHVKELPMSDLWVRKTVHKNDFAIYDFETPNPEGFTVRELGYIVNWFMDYGSDHHYCEGYYQSKPRKYISVMPYHEHCYSFNTGS